ncbi:hypothetical protein C2S51_031055 [Perilla frutescens var. frutescens]|nr:hypothetical protein C2S51_031055 [Perilla frutescens var. frutescens]
MESLLCNEVWLMSPDPACIHANAHLPTKQDFDETFATFQRKETRYLPQSGYLNLIHTHHSIRNARFKAVTWIIKSRTRMDLSPETLFAAVNYLDRFISLSQCQGWKCWMFELLSVACLSIATKFNDTTAYQLHEFQEDLENSFSPNLIQRMELTVLKALDWRVDSTTPFSYIHLLTPTNKTLVEELTQRVTQLLVVSLLDPKLLEFQQCVVAIAAVRTVFQDLHLPPSDYAHLADTLIPQDIKDDLIRCQRLMEKLVVEDGIFLAYSGPSSPVTVLKVDLFNFYDISLKTTAKNMDLRSSRKRKMEEEGF